jgi:ABC-2 type transport system permease protein
MNRILDLSLNDIAQVLRDKLSFLFLLIMPVAFTLMFAFAFGGLGGKTGSTTVLNVGVIDQDRTPASAGLVSLLGSDIKVQSATALNELNDAVTGSKLAAGIVIPSGYGASLSLGQQAAVLQIITAPTGSAGLIVRSAVDTAARRVDAAAAAAAATAGNGAPEYQKAFTLALGAWKTAPVTLKTATISAAEKKGGSTLPSEQTAPAMMLQFGMAGLITAAQVVVSERKSRCLQRLITTSMRRWQILLGHFLAMFAIIFGQFILLIGFGQLALGLNYLAQPLATLLMAAASALFIAGLGLLIGALAKTDDQAVLFSMIPMFLFSGLGGAWVPLASTGKTFQLVGHFTPVAWAMDGFQAILTQGLGLGAVALPALILLGYAALFGGLAVWRFKFES